MRIKLYKRKIQKPLLISIVKITCLVPLLPNTASALEWLFDPRVTLEQGYDDNFFLDSNSDREEEVSSTILTGELALRGKSERTDVEALLGLDAVNHGGDNDRLDDKGNQLLGLSALHKVSDRNEFTFDARLFRDTITRTEAIIVEPQDVLIGEDGVLIDDEGDVDVNLVDDNVRRTRFTINPGWSYRFSERTQGSLKYKYTDVSYSGDRGTSLVEFDKQNLTGRLRYRLSEKSTITGTVDAGFYRPDSNQDVDTYEAKLGLIHNFSETLKLDFTVGPRYSEFENSIDSSDTGVVANIGATKIAGLTTYRVNLERRVNPSGFGNQVETDTITFNVKRDLSPTLDFIMQRARV